MFLHFSELAAELTAFQFGEAVLQRLSIDSRSLQSGDCYLALRGKHLDGHDFIDQAIEAGASAIISERALKLTVPQLVVADTRLALAQIARLWRQKSQAQVIAVTGSNGKTTVKEMLAMILSVNAPVLATQGNLNNDIGVPLTLLRLQSEHRYAVIEMGANHAGEIAYSSRYALAQAAIINNVSAAHLEGFGDLSGVAYAKGEIISGLPNDGIAILNREDEFFPLWQSLAGQRQILTFGLSETADVYASDIRTQQNRLQITTTFILHYAGQSQMIELQLAGIHNVRNALAAATACLAIGISLPQIQQGLAQFVTVTGRLQPWFSRWGNVVLDDTYNANPASLAAGLSVLMQYSGEPWLILGDLGELGSNSVEIHRQLGQLVKAYGIKRLFAVGNATRYSVESFGNGGEFFEQQSELIERLISELTGTETLLIKGSRSQKMEQVSSALIEHFRQ